MKRSEFLSNKKFKQSTKDTYSYVLLALQDYLDECEITVEQLTPEFFQEFLDNQDWSNSHQRTCWFALRSYLKWAKLPDHPIFEFKIDREEPMLGRTLTYSQFQQLLDAARHTRLPIMATRNVAILWTLWHTLIRASELCRIEMQHVDLGCRTLQVRTKAKALQPRKPQTKRLFPESAAAIAAWQRERGKVATSGMTDRLFISQSYETDGVLTRAGLQALFYRLGARLWEMDNPEEAALLHQQHQDGILTKKDYEKALHQRRVKISPHDFRRGGASYMIEIGVPARLVKKQGGWKSWDVFNRYTEGAQLSAMDDYVRREQDDNIVGVPSVELEKAA